MLQKNLSKRAIEELDFWFSTLSHKDRRKLKTQGSPWGRSGGNIVAVGLRHGKTARRKKKLKRQREARFKAEQAAYEARLANELKR
jgi:hypothetical protein